MSSAATRNVSSLTSNGMKRVSDPFPAMASSSSRVFSEVPDPSSTSVSAVAVSTISRALRARIARSARVK
jgi:hypothetical protein